MEVVPEAPEVPVVLVPPVLFPLVVAPCLCSPDGFRVCPLVSKWNVLVGLTDLGVHRPGNA